MGDLKRAVKRTVRHVTDSMKNTISHPLDAINPYAHFKDKVGQLSRLNESFKEGSFQIAEKLGYEKAGLSPKSEKTKQQLAAAIEPVVPIADDEELRRARRRRIASQPRAGRASTILSGEDDTLG